MRTVKITSDGTTHGACISLDGVDISSSVTGFQVSALPGGICSVWIDLIGKLDLELPAEVMLVEPGVTDDT